MLASLAASDYDTTKIGSEIRLLDGCLNASAKEKRAGGYTGSTALFHLSKFVKKS